MLQGGYRGGQGQACGGAEGGVLVAEQVGGLEVPGQELGVQEEPLGAELVEQAGLVGGGAELGEEGLGLLGGKKGRPVRVQIAPEGAGGSGGAAGRGAGPAGEPGR